MKSKIEKTVAVSKLILFTGKLLQLISVKATLLFAARLFTTPIKHKIPKREIGMDTHSVQQKISIPSIKKEIIVYQYGTANKKILLVHGWSGRGTQLVKIADELLKKGYSTISFDAPAHGKSPGNQSIMTEFIASIMEVDRLYGPFQAAIGHSLGGMALLNATKEGLKIAKLVTIGSGDKVKDILDDFVAKLKLKPEMSDLLQLHFEHQFGTLMDRYSAYHAAKEITIPVLVIHDENDSEVPVKSALHIHQHLKKGTLFLTKKLGHRKILGNPEVIEKTVNFIIH